MSPPTHSLRVRAWCTAWPHCPFTPLLWTPQVLSGHEGPISSLCFNPVKSVLASASWDKTVRLWDMADSWRTTETLGLTSDGGHLGTGTRCSRGREAWSQGPWGPAGRVCGEGGPCPQGLDHTDLPPPTAVFRVCPAVLSEPPWL